MKVEILKPFWHNGKAQKPGKTGDFDQKHVNIYEARGLVKAVKTVKKDVKKETSSEPKAETTKEKATPRRGK